MSALALCLLLSAAPARAAVTPSRAFPGIRIDDRGRAAEREAIEGALAALQGSRAAREREALRRRARLEAVVVFDALDAPADAGLMGRAELDTGSARVLLKESLLTAPHGLHQTLAHELYGHALTRGLAPKFLSSHIARLEEDEAHSSVLGAVAARELGYEEIPDARLDALLTGAGGYHAEVLFTDSPHRVTLSLAEARNPGEAVAARLRELARRRRTLDARDAGDRVWRAAFAHFEKAHRTPPAAFAAARASIEAWRKEVTAPRRALLDAAEGHLKEVVPFLATEEGLGYSRIMIALTRDAYPAALARETDGLARRLADLRKAAAAKAPPPADEAAPAAPAGALSWEAVQELYDRDHAEFPAHWKNEARAAPAGEWLAP